MERVGNSETKQGERGWVEISGSIFAKGFFYTKLEMKIGTIWSFDK